MENRLISLATNLAEKQLRDGTASAQVISQLLKLGSSRERLEQQRIAYENDLMLVKKEALESQARTEELYKKALNAMRSYSGQEPIDFGDDFDGDYDD
jgi:hypothetical protein